MNAYMQPVEDDSFKYQRRISLTLQVISGWIGFAVVVATLWGCFFHVHLLRIERAIRERPLIQVTEPGRIDVVQPPETTRVDPGV